MPRANAADVQAAIKGVGFPTDRAHLIEYAAGRGAPEEVLETLRSLPQGEYSDAADVGQAMGQLS